MVLNGFEQLSALDVQEHIYATLPDANEISLTEQSKMLNQIINILGRAYLKYDTCDKAVIQNEEIIKVLLGIEYSGSDAPAPFVKLRDILSTPMQSLIDQMDRVQSTWLNLSVIRIVFALLINGEGDDLIEHLSKAFPQYFRQIEKVSQ